MTEGEGAGVGEAHIEAAARTEEAAGQEVEAEEFADKTAAAASAATAVVEAPAELLAAATRPAEARKSEAQRRPRPLLLWPSRHSVGSRFAKAEHRVRIVDISS